MQINILEIRRPELDAMIVADTVARQIENRINYKRAIKMSIASALRMGAEGIKIKSAISSPITIDGKLYGFLNWFSALRNNSI